MIAETARLATELTLKDGLTPGLGKSQAAVGKFDSRLGRAGKSVGKFGGQLKTAGAVAGGVFAGGVLLGIKTGLQNLGELESATTSVTGAIQRMGKTGKVTAGQVAQWANQIEEATQAAFDDKEITAASANLIRYGRVTVKNLRPAMVVMTDLAARTGSVDSASRLLAKALADPTKASGALRKAGVVLTAAQEKQIKSLVKAGKTAKAQDLILRALSKSTKGAAAAMNGPYVDAQKQLDDAVEDGTKLLAVGFLPLITKLSGKLRKLVSDPKVQKDIKAFGEGLASGFDKLVTLAEKVPWGTIADGLKKSAEWAGKLFDAFRSLPPEAQATIVALAGLNKLSGGAVTGIVSELGKGLIKGVLGMTAGVVNIQAGVVNGAGGIPGEAGTAAGAAGGGVAGLLGAAGAGAIALAVGAGMKEGWKQVSENLFPPDFAKMTQGILNIVNPLVGAANTLESIPGALGDIAGAIKHITNPTPANKPSSYVNPFGAGPVNQGSQTKGWAEALRPTNRKITDLQHGAVSAIDRTGKDTKHAIEASKQGTISNERTEQTKSRAKLSALQAAEQRNLVAFRAGERATLGVKTTVSSKLAAANAKLDAIRHKKTSINIRIPISTSVSVRDIAGKTTTSVRYNTRAINQAQ